MSGYRKIDWKNCWMVKQIWGRPAGIAALVIVKAQVRVEMEEI